jgi:hypothetical protein
VTSSERGIDELLRRRRNSRRTNHLHLNLDKPAQAELTAMFTPIVKATKTADTVPFDPSYRADAGEVLTITPYTLPSGLAPLIDADSVAVLPALNANEVEQAGIRAIAAIEWKGDIVPAFLRCHRDRVNEVVQRYCGDTMIQCP